MTVGVMASCSPAPWGMPCNGWCRARTGAPHGGNPNPPPQRQGPQGHVEYWKAQCGESRTLRLGGGKGRKPLPIRTKSIFSLREPAGKFKGKAMESRLPVADRHGPFLGDILQSQGDHLKDGLIRGKNPMMARHLASRHVDQLDGVGGVDHLAHVLWESEQGDHAAEVACATFC